MCWLRLSFLRKSDAFKLHKERKSELFETRKKIRHILKRQHILKTCSLILEIQYSSQFYRIAFDRFLLIWKIKKISGPKVSS